MISECPPSPPAAPVTSYSGCWTNYDDDGAHNGPRHAGNPAAGQLYYSQPGDSVIGLHNRDEYRPPSYRAIVCRIERYADIPRMDLYCSMQNREVCRHPSYGGIVCLLIPLIGFNNIRQIIKCFNRNVKEPAACKVQP
jgi:hypothetical protein